MTKYIDKDTLVAEVESLRCTTFTNFDEGVNATVQTLLEMLDTLEVEEMDLEKEIKSWLEHGHITDTHYGNYGDDDIENTARHFYELGLKSKKGE